MYTLTDRRSAIAAMASAMCVWALSPSFPVAAGTTARVLPPRLRQGDTVGLVCPAGFVADRFGIEEISETVRAMGLVPKLAPNLMDRFGYLAGQDEQRADALQAMFLDREVRAIFSVRGGWGCQRLLPFLDFDAIRAHPKLLVGSSDITALHMAIAARAGFPSIHGPNISHSWPPATWQSFRNLAFEAGTPNYEVPQDADPGLSQRRSRLRTFRPGKARGKLLGGNLSVLSALVGTPWLPDFAGAILFLEDTNEAEYRIDRMLTQLSQGGIFEKLSGVVFGQCTNCGNPGEPFGNFTIYEVLDQHFARLGIPAFQGAEIGHIARQVSIPVGIAAEMDADAGTIRLLEPAVA